MVVIKVSDCEIHLVTIKSAIHFEEIILNQSEDPECAKKCRKEHTGGFR